MCFYSLDVVLLNFFFMVHSCVLTNRDDEVRSLLCAAISLVLGFLTLLLAVKQTSNLSALLSKRLVGKKEKNSCSDKQTAFPLRCAVKQTAACGVWEE